MSISEEGTEEGRELLRPPSYCEQYQDNTQANNYAFTHVKWHVCDYDNHNIQNNTKQKCCIFMINGWYFVLGSGDYFL